MEADYKIFNQITIDESVPRIYFHKSKKYMFNNKALDAFGLTNGKHIIITNFHRNKYIASIEVEKADNRRVEIAKMYGMIFNFPANVQNQDEPFFSYELIPMKYGRHVFKIYDEEKIVLRTKKLTPEMKKPRETYLEQQQAKQRENVKSVCELLELSENEYNELLFENGFMFLEKKGIIKFYGDNYTQKPRFWQWWKNQYYIVDDASLRKFQFELQSKGELTELLEGRTLREWYNYEHVDNINTRLDDYIFNKENDRTKTKVNHES